MAERDRSVIPEDLVDETEPKVDFGLVFRKRITQYCEQVGTDKFVDEITFTGITSSKGAGGQGRDHNNTAIQAFWNVETSKFLSKSEKKRLISEKRLEQLTDEGIVVLTAQNERDQVQNKEDARKRLIGKVEDALKEKKKRIPTKKSKSRRQKERKKRVEHSRKKSERAKSKRIRREY